MNFQLCWTIEATQVFEDLQNAAERAAANRAASKKQKSSKQEGLFKQIAKAIKFLGNDPRHPGLETHEYDSIDHPFDPSAKVFEAYAQNNTPCAYRVFWCYGPKQGELTIIAITPHP